MSFESEGQRDQHIAFRERMANLDSNIYSFLRKMINGIPEEERIDSIDRNERRSNDSFVAEWKNAIINYRLLSRFLEKHTLPSDEEKEILDNLYVLSLVDDQIAVTDVETKRHLLKNLSLYLYNVLQHYKKQDTESMLDS